MKSHWKKRRKQLFPCNQATLKYCLLLDLNEEIIGVNDWDNYPEEALEKEKIGGMEFDVEKIIAMNPEIVFAHESALGVAAEGFQQLRDAGIPVFVVKNATEF